jgi:hypothetical protein
VIAESWDFEESIVLDREKPLVVDAAGVSGYEPGEGALAFSRATGGGDMVLWPMWK